MSDKIDKTDPTAPTAPPPAKPRVYTPTCAARTAVDGRSTVITVGGAGPGRHTGTVRLWPHGQEVGLAWDDDTHALSIVGLHDRGVAVLDGGPELRFAVTDTDAEVDGPEPAVRSTPTLSPDIEPSEPRPTPPGTKVRLDPRTGAEISNTANAAPRPLKPGEELRSAKAPKS